MIKSLLLFAYLILFYIIGFTQIHSGPGDSLDKIMIDPYAGVGGTSSEIYDEVNYIPLETSKESLFGEITQLCVTDLYYIIYDKSTDAILFFNKDGSFHHKITKFSFDEKLAVRTESQQGVRAGNMIESFSIDPFKQNLIIKPNIRFAKFLYVFSFDGKPISKLTLPANTQSYYFLKNGTQFYKQYRPYSLSRLSGYNPYDVLLTKDSGIINKYLFPVNFKTAALLNDMFMHINYFNYSGDHSRCLYTPDLDNNVYELDSTGIRHQYQFIFPIQYSLPKDFGYDSIYTNKRRTFLKDKSLITNFWGVYKIGNYLILDIRINSPNQSNNFLTLLYSLNTTRLILLDHISPDSKSHYMPISGPSNFGILACDGKSIFINLPSITMFQAKEETADKHPKYNNILKNYFKTQNRKSNPVIVQLKPKGNL